MLHTLRARRGMVVAPHHLAAQAGRDVLREGDNAIEAAVATAACLAVVYPHMTGIGGDGFWLIHEADGRVHAIDACGRAAQAATLDFYRGHAHIPWREPGAANTVAGTVSGWALALQQATSSLSLQRLLSDAIHHATAGVPVTLGGAQVAASKRAELRPQPGAYAEIFEPHGAALREGALLRQAQLARTLQRLADEGLESFYRGAIAHDIAADLQAFDSPLSAHDLATHRAETSVPLSVVIQGARLYNHAPPTQGLASLLILALFDRLKVEDADSYAHLHGLIEASTQAFLIRDAHLGDPAWMTLDAQALLDDDAALDALAARIDMSAALPWPQPSQAGDTVWFGAIDAHGRAVSCIQSTYFEFGSGLVLPRTGITWQNRGCSFRLAPDGWNALVPGAQTLPHPQPGAGHLRRRQRHGLRHHGRRRPTADPGRRVFPLRPLRPATAAGDQRTALAARPHLGRRQHCVEAGKPLRPGSGASPAQRRACGGTAAGVQLGDGACRCLGARGRWRDQRRK